MSAVIPTARLVVIPVLRLIISSLRALAVFGGRKTVLIAPVFLTLTRACLSIPVSTVIYRALVILTLLNVVMVVVIVAPVIVLAVILVAVVIVVAWLAIIPLAVVSISLGPHTVPIVVTKAVTAVCLTAVITPTI